MKKLKVKSKEELNKIAGEAWLNLDVDEQKIYNPLLEIPPFMEDKPHIYIAYLLTRPEYFSFICKEILNVEILPIQGLMLKELWHRKFPMLIASRGFSKSFLLAVLAWLKMLILKDRKIVLTGSVFRQSKIIFQYMVQIYENAPILRDLIGKSSREVINYGQDRWTLSLGNSYTYAIPIGATGEKIRGYRCLGKETLIQTDKGLLRIQDYINGESYSLQNINDEFETPDKIYITPKVDVYKVTTVNGYSFRCSDKHKVMTIDGWKKAIDLTENDHLPLVFSDYFPKDKIELNDLIVNKDIGWLMGLLISEGTITNRNFIQITNTDKNLIEKIKNRIKLDWKEYFKEAYKDGRGWNCKESYNLYYNGTKFRTSLYCLGLNYVTSRDKVVPWCILQSPKEVVVEFLKGLYMGDGSHFQYDFKKKKRLNVCYYSGSEQLINELQILLLKFGIISGKVNRSSKLSNKTNWILSCRGIHAINLCKLLDVDDIDFDSISYFERKPHIRKSDNGKRFCVSTCVNNKTINLGTFDTKEECIRAFDEYWSKNRESIRVKNVEKLNDKEVLYDFHMPKTHSFYGNGVIQHNSNDIFIDEFKSVPREIFETVISGFGAVSSDPLENVKRAAAIKKLEEMGIEIEFQEDDFVKSNQLVISGTTDYYFNHFYDYWKRWKSIIHSKGNIKDALEFYGEESRIDESLNWRNFSVIRIPIELIPEGFMDEENIARSKATMTVGTYYMEYGAIFVKDTQGYFKRSLLEECTVKDNKVIEIQGEKVDCKDIMFYPMLSGNPNKNYVMGVDTASAVDNFSIVIEELNGHYSKIVYCWTTNKQSHKELLKANIIGENNFYAYCARKIRDLMKAFNIVNIAIDSQGGGLTVMEALNDKDKMEMEEEFIWPIIEDGKEKDTDDHPGLHIIHVINFASQDWTVEANNGLKKDFQTHSLLFPNFDPLTLGEAELQDMFATRMYDTMEECVIEIEEMKDELVTIVITQTPSGRYRWDTPEVKGAEHKKGRLRKDRYSALLMANWAARQIHYKPKPKKQQSYGGFAHKIAKNQSNDKVSFTGPDWFTKVVNQGVYD